MSRPVGTSAELERRRRRAVALVAQGEPRKALARWLRLARRPDGLAAKPHPGPAPGLSDADLRRLEALLSQGAQRHGWRNQLWTAARVAALIRKHFGRDY